MSVHPKDDLTKILVGKDVPFQRVRRITGYLNSSLARFNDAKKAEVADRVTHMSAH